LATEVIKSINPLGGGDYISLAAWVADRQGDLVSRDTIEIAEIYGGESVGILDLQASGWTTNSTHYIIVRAASNQGHDGIFNINKAYVKTTSGPAMVVGVPYTRIGTGISIETTDSSVTVPSLYCDAGTGTCIFEGLIVRNLNGYTARMFSSSPLAANGNLARNCVFLHGNGKETYCIETGDISGTTPGVHFTFYNCTIVQLRLDEDCVFTRASSPPSDNAAFENCYFYGNEIIYGGNGGTIKGDNDATSNNEAKQSGLRNVLLNTDNFTNVDYSTFDARIKPASVLVKAGKNLSAGIFGFEIDYEEDPRAGPFDIGADEIYPNEIVDLIDMIQTDLGLDSSFTESMINTFIIKAIRRINRRLGFTGTSNEISIDFERKLITPTPNDTILDLIIMQTECLIMKNKSGKAGSSGIRLKDGDSEVDLGAGAKVTIDLTNSICKELNDAIIEYLYRVTQGDVIWYGNRRITQDMDHDNEGDGSERDFSSPFDSSRGA